MNNMNSGYSGYSMSNRAVEAYANGEKPKSKWTKKEIIAAIEDIDSDKAELFNKVSLSALKDEVLIYSSWHHTSGRCNKTDFYMIDEDYIESISEEQIKELAKREKPIKEERKIRKGSIEYLEWGGTRKHPKATKKKLENVNIEERGCFYYVTDDNGKELLKKKIDSNGTKVIFK